MGLTSGRTCTPTLSSPVAPPCTPVLPTECRRRSPLLPHPPSRSRLSLRLRGSTPSGSEDPSWPPSPPSSRCGSPSRSTTSPAPPLFTGSASKRSDRSKIVTSSKQNNQVAPSSHCDLRGHSMTAASYFSCHLLF